MEYHDQDFITKDIKTIPGFNYIQQVHSETEQKLKRELPKSFPLSLWMTTFSVSDESRQELIIPENNLNIAHDFEDIFRRYNALEMILEKGYKYSYERSEEELLTFFALT